MKKCSTPDCDRPAKGRFARFCTPCGAVRRATFKRKYIWTPAMDDRIREAYRVHLSTRRSLSIKDTLGKRFGYPPWAVQQRAGKLGLCRPKEKPWTEAELELLEKHAWKSAETIEQILRAAGFVRSHNAIWVKRNRHFVGGRVEQYPFYSANRLAQLMGIDGHCVTAWINGGLLKAKRRGTAHMGDRDFWMIYPEHVRKFLVAHPIAFDLRKVDQLWFMDVLTNRTAEMPYRRKPEAA
jgi:hypothetical protein